MQTGNRETIAEHVRKPDWLKIKLNTNDNYTGLKKMMRENNLNTVCEAAVVQISMNVGESVVPLHL